MFNTKTSARKQKNPFCEPQKPIAKTGCDLFAHNGVIHEILNISSAFAVIPIYSVPI